MWLAASSFEVPDGVLATRATALLNPKPHQGLSSKNPAPHPALDEPNSTAAIGLRASLALNRLRQSERARYYASALGRFTSPDDPFADQNEEDPQSWNLYSYGRNNPLRNVDLDGRACSHAKAPNGADIVTDLDGKGCGELHDNTVHGDEPGLLMLAGIGEKLTNGANVAQFVSDAGRSAASIIAPQASAMAECITPGGSCNKTNLALAAVPFGRGQLAHILRRHSSLTVAKNVSKFARGLDDASHIESLIESALASPGRATAYADGAAYIEADLGVTIGTDISGNSTTKIRVVLDSAGDVHSAYPIPQHP